MQLRNPGPKPGRTTSRRPSLSAALIVLASIISVLVLSFGAHQFHSAQRLDSALGRAVAGLASEEDVGIIVRQASRDVRFADEERNLAALRATGPRSLLELSTVLDDERNLLTCYCALRTVARMGLSSSQVIVKCSSFLGHEQLSIRVAAVEALVSIGGSDVRTVLDRAARDPRVGAESAWGLCVLNTDEGRRLQEDDLVDCR